MIRETCKKEIVRYIHDRICPDGGFCFYRLNEPNAGDTFYAISLLSLLGTPFSDRKTIGYLEQLQREEGSYPSFYVGYYALESLSGLGKRPRHDPARWLASIDPLLPDAERSPESRSRFERLYLYADLCRTLGVSVAGETRTSIRRYVDGFRHADGGFGGTVPTLIETYHAFAIISWLGYGTGSTGASRFLARCEDRKFGFLNVPGSRPSYLEHLFAGVHAAAILECRSPALQRCREIVEQLQTANGGFVRSVYGGSPTLEYTYLAVRTLVTLSMIEEGEDARWGPKVLLHSGEVISCR